MRIFGSEKMDVVLRKLGLKEGEAIFHPWMSKALEKAQQRVESRNYDIRKNLLKFDDVMNDQRKVIYEQRIELMQTADVSETVNEMRDEIINDLISTYIPEKAYAEQWDTETLHKEVLRIFSINLPISDWAKSEGIADKEILERVSKAINEHIANKENTYGAELMRLAEKRILLFSLDQLWKDHLLSLDHLRQGINLRAYAQKDPLNEYKREAFMMFQGMLGSLREVVISRISHFEIKAAQRPEAIAMPAQKRKMHESRVDPAMAGNRATQEDSGNQPQVPVRNIAPGVKMDVNDPSTWGKVGRNDQCPCGSGRKYKHCHGVI